jgi:hypothetical protein
MNAGKQAEIAKIMIAEISKPRAICADAMDAKADAHPFIVQSYARWAGRFKIYRMPGVKGRPVKNPGGRRNNNDRNTELIRRAMMFFMALLFVV